MECHKVFFYHCLTTSLDAVPKFNMSHLKMAPKVIGVAALERNGMYSYYVRLNDPQNAN